MAKGYAVHSQRIIVKGIKIMDKKKIIACIGVACGLIGIVINIIGIRSHTKMIDSFLEDLQDGYF